MRLASTSLASIDIFNPVYGAQPGPFGALAPLNDQELKYSALYLQDQIWLGERWKLLLGLRYDDTRQTTVSSSGTTVNDDASIPRVRESCTTWRHGHRSMRATRAPSCLPSERVSTGHRSSRRRETG